MDFSIRIKSWLDSIRNPDGSILPFLVLVFLTVIFLYPVSVFPHEIVLGRPFDNVFESIGYLDWYKRAIFDLHISPLFNPDAFYPEGWDLRFSVMPPLFPILLAPVTAVLGSVVTYNLVIIISTIIAAFGVYTLQKAMGGNFFGGLYAGMLYAFYPNRQVYMSGFLNLLLASMWLPWMLFGIYQAVYHPERRNRWLIFAALCYALSIASAWQYAYISTLALVLYGSVLIGAKLKREGRAWIKPLFVFAGVALLVAAPSLILGLQGQKSIGNAVQFPLTDLIATSPSLERFILPSGMNPLTWKLTREMFPQGIGENSMIFFGYLTILLVLWAMWRWRPWHTPEWGLLALVVGALLFMTGPYLKWMNAPITLGEIKIPMPPLLVYKYIPPFETFHHFGRIGLLAALGLGILAGLGLTTLMRKKQTFTRYTVSMACICLLLIEINMQPHHDVTSIAGMQRDVDNWLAEQETQGVIIEYPLDYASKSQALYHVIKHQQKMVHNYALPPAHYTEIKPILEQWPEEETINLLSQLGVDYILVDVFQNQENFETQQLPLLKAIPQLSFVGRFHRQVDQEDVSDYLFGQIHPHVDWVKDVYLFQLHD